MLVDTAGLAGRHYKIELAPDHYTQLEAGWGSLTVLVQPLAGLLDGYRAALLWGRAPDIESLLYLAGVSSAVLIFGFALFSRGEGRPVHMSL